MEQKLPTNEIIIVEPKEACQSLLTARLTSTTELLFATLSGSRAYNLQTVSSDYDCFGVYTVDPVSFWGLNAPSEVLSTREPTDVTLHEIGKFANQILTGNPSAFEALYTEHNCYRTELWKELQKERRRFLSKNVIKQYLAMAQGQIKQIESKPQDSKKIYNALRLGMEAIRLAKGQEPLIWFNENTPEHSYFKSIRNGCTPLPELLSKAKQQIQEVDSLKPWPVPDRGDEQWLNEWLIRLRTASYEKCHSQGK